MTRAQRLALYSIGLAAVSALLGCAQWRYEQVALRSVPEDIDRSFAPELTRKTSLGIAHLRGDGPRDAVVILLTNEQRVAAKFRAREHARDWGFSIERGYELRGEIDPESIATDVPGPIALLRAIAANLGGYRGEPLAEEAHALVAAGLVRVMQRWPGVSDYGVRGDALEPLLQRVPGGGAATIAVDEDGTYHVTYRQGVTH